MNLAGIAKQGFCALDVVPAGLSVAADLAKAKLDLLKARGDLLQAAADWNAAEAKLRQAMGLLVRE